jgi:hypothetical protein
MSHELIPLTDGEAWDRALADIPHPHAHTRRHVAAFQASSPDEALLYVHRDAHGAADVACPIAVRGAPGERDAYTPYGFGGFAAARPVPTFAAEWDSFAGANGWVASYVFQSPLLDPDLGFPVGAFVPVGACYVLDLGRPVDDLLARTSPRRRAELRRWARGHHDLTSDPAEVTAFLIAEAAAFFAARDAAPIYRLSGATWADLISSPTVWCVAAREDGRVAAASVFGESCGMVDYLFGISRPGASAYSAPLLWEAVTHFVGTSAITLNLGGGITPGDGVAEFKRRFGPDELTFSSGRFVHRPDAYGDLCRRAGVGEDRDGYFPPYRRVRS